MTTISVKLTGRAGLAVGLATLLLGLSVPGGVFANQCDLVVTPLSVSTTSLSPGDPFTINATVSNLLGTAPSATTLRYFRSTDSTISTADTPIGTDAVPLLAAGATSPESTGASAPTTPGTFFIGACVDPVSGEASNANNCSSGVQITVNSPPTISPIADQNIPQNSTTGAIGFTVSDAETTPSSLAVTTSSSNITLIPNANVVLGGAGANRTITVIPAADQSGSATITVTVSDGRDSTNESFTVTVAPPDLVVSALMVSKTSLSPGESFTIDATVRNAGGGGSAGTTLRYFRSTDSAISTADTPIGTDAIPVLAGGATSPQSIAATAPTTLGPFYIGACVDAVSGETNTGNNCFTPGVQITVAPPDLVVTPLTVSKTNLSPGEPFTINATARNQGQMAPTGTTLRYFRSTDSTISTADTQIGTDTIPALLASATSPQSTGASAPTAPGTYFIGACVDTVSGEANTGNNCFTPGVQITVALAVTVTATPAPARVGEVVNWGFDVSNPGPGDATAVVLDIDLHAQDAGLALEQAVAGCTLVVDTPDQLSWTCALGNLSSGQTTTISASVTAAQKGDMWGRAAVRSATAGIDPADNAAALGVNIAEQLGQSVAQVLGSANSRAVVLGDVNTDGSLDVVVITGAGEPTEIYVDDGAGGFTLSVNLGDTANSNAGVLADIDNDGGLDLILANGAGEANTIYRNDGSGTFSLSQGLGAAASHDVVAADIDGNGSLDLVFANSDGPNTVYRNDGGGTFSLSQGLGTAASHDVVAVDVDGGGLDLVFANSDGPNTIYRNDGSGTFSLLTSLGTGGGQAVGTADFNRDGRQDLVFGNAVQSAAQTTPPFNQVYLGDGAGGFTLTASVGHVDTLDVVTGDVDGDGLTDFVVINATGGHQVYLGDGAGGFTLDPSFIVGTGAVTAVLADLDGDTDLDLVLSNGVAGGSTVILNSGSGFDAALSSATTDGFKTDSGSSDCFIATAAYGPAGAAEIAILRQFRDRLLLPTPPGRAFVGWYYRTSPPYAVALAQHPRLRQGVRTALWPVVYSAQGILWIGEYPYGGMVITLILSGFLVLTRYRRRRVHRCRYQPRNLEAQTHGQPPHAGGTRFNIAGLPRGDPDPDRINYDALLNWMLAGAPEF